MVLEPWPARDHRRHAESRLAGRRGHPPAHRHALRRRKGDLGKDARTRHAIRNERSRPLVAELETFLRAQTARLSGRSEMGKAVTYLLNHWDGLTLFLHHGRIEMDTNLVENQIRPLTLTRKNALFAGHDEGGRLWACLASLIATCRLKAVQPHPVEKRLSRRSRMESQCPPSTT